MLSCLINRNVSKALIIWINFAPMIVVFHKTWTKNINTREMATIKEGKKKKQYYILFHILPQILRFCWSTHLVRTWLSISAFHFILDKINFVAMVSERGHGIHLRILQDFLNSSGAWGMGHGARHWRGCRGDEDCVFAPQVLNLINI